MSANTCISCGVIIPEGRWMCPRCEGGENGVNKATKRTLAARSIFVGCQFCGETDMTLRNYGAGKICPRCLKERNTVPNSGTGKGQKND